MLGCRHVLSGYIEGLSLIYQALVLWERQAMKPLKACLLCCCFPLLGGKNCSLRRTCLFCMSLDRPLWELHRAFRREVPEPWRNLRKHEPAQVVVRQRSSASRFISAWMSQFREIKNLLLRQQRQKGQASTAHVHQRGK